MVEVSWISEDMQEEMPAKWTSEVFLGVSLARREGSVFGAEEQ